MNPAPVTALNAFSMGRGLDPFLGHRSTRSSPHALPAVPLDPSREGSSSA